MNAPKLTDFKRYYGVDNYNQFRNMYSGDPNLPSDDQVVFALYETPPYEGYWYVLFLKDGKLWCDAGSHCSCNGVEFAPTLNTAEAVAMALKSPYGISYLNSFEGARAELSILVDFLLEKGY
jgi:hypothetical protein